ncbi:hypothetical protein BUE80_DR011567 [Diplocarpon rosae]|nr:hypothetical protein BUE80_DR011567 [Diplocarpon rosae]
MPFTPRALNRSCGHSLKVLIPLFPNLNTFDANGPIEVLSQANRLTCEKQIFELYLASSTELTRSLEGVSLARDISLVKALERVTEWDILLLPGGATDSILSIIEDWKRDKLSPSSALINLLDRYLALEDGLTLTICTGSLFLAATGKLDGRTATTHWSALSTMRKLCAQSVSETNVIRARWVDSKEVTIPRLITSGGVSCGIDAAFYLVDLIAGTELAASIAHAIEYQRRGPEVQEDYVISHL